MPSMLKAGISPPRLELPASSGCAQKHSPPDLCPTLFTLGYEGLSIEAFIARVKSEHYAGRSEAIEQAVVPQLQLPVNKLSQLARQTDSDTFKTLAITRPKVGAVTCNKYIAG